LFNANVFDFAGNFILIIVLLAWIWHLYSCIAPIAQMSRKRCYLRVKASGCWLLFSVNQCCHWGQSR